jgi:hypothetical protein
MSTSTSVRYTLVPMCKSDSRKSETPHNWRQCRCMIRGMSMNHGMTARPLYCTDIPDKWTRADKLESVRKWLCRDMSAIRDRCLILRTFL